MGFSYAITFTLCDGINVVTGGLIELVPELKELVDNTKGECKTRSGKVEGEGKISQCQYDLRYKVDSGEQIGWTGIETFPEVWAYDYNKKVDSRIRWDLYGYQDYPYAFCLFDLYNKDLKAQFNSKFGKYVSEQIKIDEKHSSTNSKFVPRTIKPICGKIIQYVLGSVQGDWFDTSKGISNIEFSGRGISLIHDNVDPILGKFSIGGNITNYGVGTFLPRHSGYINREFSEVKADKHIYCYQSNSSDVD